MSSVRRIAALPPEVLTSGQTFSWSRNQAVYPSTSVASVFRHALELSANQVAGRYRYNTLLEILQHDYGITNVYSESATNVQLNLIHSSLQPTRSTNQRRNDLRHRQGRGSKARRALSRGQRYTERIRLPSFGLLPRVSCLLPCIMMARTPGQNGGRLRRAATGH
jgi:hypothetical protein